MLVSGSKFASLLFAISSWSSPQDSYMLVCCSSLPSPGNLRELARSCLTQTHQVLYLKLPTLGIVTGLEVDSWLYNRPSWAGHGLSRLAKKFCPRRDASIASWTEQSAAGLGGCLNVHLRERLGRNQRFTEQPVSRNLAWALEGLLIRSCWGSGNRDTSVRVQMGSVTWGQY